MAGLSLREQLAMQNQPGTFGPPEMAGTVPATPIAQPNVPLFDRNADVLAALEASDVHNTEVLQAQKEGRFNTAGQMLPRTGPLPSAIAPPQPKPTGTVMRVVPGYNGGDPIEVDAVTGQPVSVLRGLLQNPMASTTVPTMSSTDEQPSGKGREPGSIERTSGVGTGELAPYRPAAPAPTLRAAMAGGQGGGFAWRISPEARKAQEAAFKAQEGANVSVEQRLRDQSVLEQSRAATHEEQAAADVERSQKTEEERKARSAALLADYDKAEKDAASTKIDAGRYWANKPTAQKVLSIIGATLGGFAAGLKGGPNHALDQLNREIERDVDDQKANLANKHAHADAKKSAYALNLQAWGNEDAARSATLAQKSAQMAAEAQRQAAESKSVEAQNQADMLSAHLAEQKAAYLQHAMGAVQAAGPSAATAAQMDRDLKFLAEQQQKLGAPETRAAIDRARASTPLRGDIAGVGPIASRMQEHFPTLHAWTYGKESEQREQDWNVAKNQAIKALSGSGVSGAEMDRMRRQFDGANDAQSRRRALDTMSTMLNSSVANVEAAVHPESVELFNQRKGLRQQMAAPAPAGPPASFKGAGR